MRTGRRLVAIVLLVSGCSASIKHVPGPTVTVKPQAIVETVTATVPGPTVTNTVTVTVAPKAKPKPKPVVTDHITYKVFGNGSTSSDITYNIGGSIEQATGARIPWTKTEPLLGSGDIVQLSAQDGDGTSITCEILDVDGTVLDKHTSTGNYAVASCQSTNAGDNIVP